MRPAPLDSEPRWRALLLGVDPMLRRWRRLFRLLPSPPRCRMCAAPFSGVGGSLMRLVGKGPWERNPSICAMCFRHSPGFGGAEVECSLLFADVRGSSALARQQSPTEFGRLMSRFYSTAGDILIRTDGIIDKLAGDAAIGLYLPLLAGTEHARRAVEGGERLLAAVAPWLHVGVGVHTGTAFVGVLGGEQGAKADFTAVGDAMNVAAHVCAHAGAGELLVTDAACRAAGLEAAGLTRRDLVVKGRSEPLTVCCLRGGDSLP